MAGVDQYEASERRRNIVAVSIVVIGLLVTVGIIIVRQRGDDDPFGAGTTHDVTLVRGSECEETWLELDDFVWRGGLWRWPDQPSVDGSAHITSESRVEFTATDGTMLELIGGRKGEAAFAATCARTPPGG